MLRGCWRTLPYRVITRSNARPPLPYATRNASTKQITKDSASNDAISSWLSPRGRLHNITRGLITGLALILALHLEYTYLYEYYPCHGISMLPTFASYGDCVLISKYYRRGRGVEVGDVVSFKHPVNSEERAIKRVLGMPGDFVMRDTPGVGEGRMIEVPQGHCWIVGDNVAHSRDSRMFGPLPLALVKGKVIARFSPWYRPHWLENGLRPVFNEDDDDVD